LVLLSLAQFLPAASAAPSGIRHIAVNGRTYVSARDWAVSRGLTVGWLVRDKTLLLVGGASRVMFTVDSLEIQFNGTSVFLSHPALGRDGSLYLSQLDVDTVLAPLLNAPRLPPGRKIRTICLDPGHGGRDPGNEEGASQEKRYTLLLAQELRSQLTRLGFKVVLTRTRDSFVDLDARPSFAQQCGADLFVSLHFNSVDVGKAGVRGAETYCLTPRGASSTNARGAGAGSGAYRGNRNDDENFLLAFQIQKSLRTLLATEDRGVRRARFAVLRDAAMPAALVEAGFLSHPSEGKKIISADYRKQMARAISDGIMAFKKSVERGN
jgi:N-acetylmuramoyl-L-alanine amidase